MGDFKSELVDAVVSGLRDRPEVLAAWEMGSAANGTTDKFSDTDFLALVEVPTDKIFEIIESILEKHAGIVHRWIEPQSVVPGQWQRIYKLRGAPAHYSFDCGLVSSSEKDALSELMTAERHGIPVVYFDKTGVIKPTSAKPGEIRRKHAERIQEIVQTYPFVYSTVMKEIERGKAIDSYAFYFGLVRRFMDVLGMIYRPERFDFSLRYLHKDLPPDLQSKVEWLIYVGTANDLKERVEALDGMYQRYLAEAKKLVAQSGHVL